MESIEAPFPMAVGYYLKEISYGVVLSVSLKGDPDGYSKFSERILSRTIRHNLKSDLRNLKRRLEKE